MQVIGRPFGEVAVLRVGHAYQQATRLAHASPATDAGRAAAENRSHRQTRRQRRTSTPRRAILCCAPRSVRDSSSTSTRTAILLETAPFALAMAERNRKPRDRAEEPALVFRFPVEVLGCRDSYENQFRRRKMS